MMNVLGTAIFLKVVGLRYFSSYCNRQNVGQVSFEREYYVHYNKEVFSAVLLLIR